MRVTFAYDADDLLTRAGVLTVTRDGPTGFVDSQSLAGLTWTFDRNTFGEIDTRTVRFGPQQLWSSEVLARDAQGRVLTRREALGGEVHVQDYAYDLAGRLTDLMVDGESSAHYEYDANGNRLLEVRDGLALESRHDAQDRLVSSGGNLFTYTPDGALESKTDATANATTFYRYDLASNLLGVTLPNGDEIEYLVDAEGRRIGRKLNGVFPHRWVYGAEAGPVAEVDATGNVVTRFVYGARSWVPSYMVRGGRTYAIVTDAVGSVRLVVDSATGDVLQRLDYDAYGRVVRDTNPGVQPFGFAGGIFDPATGLLRLGARDYDAEVGRWTTKDPLLFGGNDSNVYAYAAGDPINKSDPSGMIVASLAGACEGYPIACGALALGFAVGIAVTVAPSCIRDGTCGDLIADLQDQAFADSSPVWPLGGGQFPWWVPGSVTSDENPFIPPYADTACRDGSLTLATRNTPDQDALIQIAKDANNRGGVTSGEAEILKGWGKELDVNVRGPESHPDRPHGKNPHIHVGPVDHIPVKP